MPQLPASGIISASMINIALGNPAGDEISWSDMATEYDLSGSNGTCETGVDMIRKKVKKKKYRGIFLFMIIIIKIYL